MFWWLHGVCEGVGRLSQSQAAPAHYASSHWLAALGGPLHLPASWREGENSQPASQAAKRGGHLCDTVEYVRVTGGRSQAVRTHRLPGAGGTFLFICLALCTPLLPLCMDSLW